MRQDLCSLRHGSRASRHRSHVPIRGTHGGTHRTGILGIPDTPDPCKYAKKPVVAGFQMGDTGPEVELFGSRENRRPPVDWLHR